MSSQFCPICGMTAERQMLTESGVMRTAVYVCADGHLFQVWWTEVVG